MICVSLLPDTLEQALTDLQGVAMAEVRLEHLVVSGVDIKPIFQRPCRLVATCRPTVQLTEDERATSLVQAIEAGAAFVDLEIEASGEFFGTVQRAAHAKGCQVIVSYHNYETTPTRATLCSLVEECFRRGADIAKVACMAHSGRDAARMLSLLDSELSIIAIAMGMSGTITRVAGPLLGSPFTYAPLQKETQTAPGQIPRDVLAEVYRQLEL